MVELLITINASSAKPINKMPQSLQRLEREDVYALCLLCYSSRCFCNSNG